MLAIIGLSSGIIVAGGLFALLISLGVVSKFASRTHTGEAVLLYEEAIAYGCVVANLCFLYKIPLSKISFLLPIWGICTGIFVGCWAMALAETINIFPVFIRRIKMVRMIPYMVLSIAIGKGIGALIMFFQGWGS